jgi:hypothetical protein
MLKQVEAMKNQTKINQIMKLIINSFCEKKIFSENLSQTSHIYMYVIKLDMNHFKMQKCLKTKRD